MFIDLPGTINENTFPIKANNVHPKNYIFFDRWISNKININDIDNYHRLITHGYKKKKFIISELYVDPKTPLRKLRIRDFHKSYFKILINEKALNNLYRIELILNDYIFFKIIIDDCTIKEIKKFNNYPNKINKTHIYNDRWFLIGIKAPHTIGTGPFEIHLY